jgi:hypothetical protein
MKRIILSLGALLAVSVASAQSYPKQPDRTIVQYVPYQKPVAEPAAAEVKADTAETKAAKPKTVQPAAVKDEKLKKAEAKILGNSKNGVALAEPTE